MAIKKALVDGLLKDIDPKAVVSSDGLWRLAHPGVSR
jgi:hypothetical protein